MKVIDLLNKIANGEELPTEIEYSRKHYYLTNNNDIDAFGSVIGMFSLNDEITILDEDYIVDTPKENKKIEKLGAFNIKKFYDDYPETANFILEIFKKQEELIDKVNGE